ncbi:MAG TPA: hypothetical protein VLC06_02540 [Polyangia bacterium]|nr:hypothetical protein [Polyangia bacterium]
MIRRAPLVALCSLASLSGCQRPPGTEKFRPSPLPDAGGGLAELAPLFVTPPRPACEFSGPLAITSQGEPEILIVTADGVFAALDPSTGAQIWQVALEAGDGLLANLAAPPALVGHRIVFAWQEVMADWTRVAHHVGVLDLDARALDPQFPALTLAAQATATDGSGPIAFLPAHAYSRAAVVHVDVPDRVLGLVYLSFGNVRDLQPWHGWLFEIDLDAWQAQAQTEIGDAGDGGNPVNPISAITGTLVTTAAGSDCGADDGDGSREMVCGGGIWAALGPEVVADPASPDGYALLVATGNGLTDPTRGSYANSVLRLGRGLSFTTGCDPTLCADFDPTAPTDACAASCDRLFIPRLPAGQSVPRGANDGCVGRTLFQCYATFDWDLGANAPAAVALPGGPNVIIQPGKDGAVYLIDADHLGTLYDRAPIMAGCGEGGGTCSATWAGTIVTKPAVTTVGGATLALVPTFVSDNFHPAGLQALELDTTGETPRFLPRWQAPAADDPDAVASFRAPPSGVTVVEVAGEPYAALADASPPAGSLYWVRVRDGAVLQKLALAGGGQRFAQPLAANGVLYVPSCQRTGTPSFEEGPSTLEAFRIDATLPP